MKKAAGKSREKAIEIEAKGFAKLAQTTEAQSLIGLFLNDQLIKAKGKKYGKIAKKVEKAAVLGAGIMGGGIAYQSAYKNVPIVMKDINQSGIDLGIGEATKLLSKIVKIGKIDAPRMAQVLANINPTLSYGKADFADVDVVVEAVVENIKVKQLYSQKLKRFVNLGQLLHPTLLPFPLIFWLKLWNIQRISVGCISLILYTRCLWLKLSVVQKQVMKPLQPLFPMQQS